MRCMAGFLTSRLSVCMSVCVCVCVQDISLKKYLINQLYFWWEPSL